MKVNTNATIRRLRVDRDEVEISTHNTKKMLGVAMKANPNATIRWLRVDRSEVEIFNAPPHDQILINVNNAKSPNIILILKFIIQHI
jgi:hypothetical protein